MLKVVFSHKRGDFFEGGCMKDWEYNELFHAIGGYEELLDEEEENRYAIAKLAVVNLII